MEIFDIIAELDRLTNQVTSTIDKAAYKRIEQEEKVRVNEFMMKKRLELIIRSNITTNTPVNKATNLAKCDDSYTDAFNKFSSSKTNLDKLQAKHNSLLNRKDVLKQILSAQQTLAKL